MILNVQGTPEIEIGGALRLTDGGIFYSINFLPISNQPVNVDSMELSVLLPEGSGRMPIETYAFDHERSVWVRLMQAQSTGSRMNYFLVNPERFLTPSYSSIFLKIKCGSSLADDNVISLNGLSIRSYPNELIGY
ncbi:MAG TPA: hypothetical protein ENN67_01230 [Firmicutes bacterium]|nr:hypothetical protein [Bacillota bacterium]